MSNGICDWPEDRWLARAKMEEGCESVSAGAPASETNMVELAYGYAKAERVKIVAAIRAQACMFDELAAEWAGESWASCAARVSRAIADDLEADRI